MTAARAIVSDPQAFRALAIARGLRLYAKTGIKPARLWTPSAMLRAASQITGRTFKRGAYTEAADAIEATLRGEA